MQDVSQSLQSKTGTAQAILSHRHAHPHPSFSGAGRRGCCCLSGLAAFRWKVEARVGEICFLNTCSDLTSPAPGAPSPERPPSLPPSLPAHPALSPCRGRTRSRAGAMLPPLLPGPTASSRRPRGHGPHSPSPHSHLQLPAAGFWDPILVSKPSLVQSSSSAQLPPPAPNPGHSFLPCFVFRPLVRPW